MKFGAPLFWYCITGCPVAPPFTVDTVPEPDADQPPGTPTLKGAEVPEATTPGEVAVARSEMPAAATFTDNALNVAMPSASETAVVPVSTAPTGALTSAIVTVTPGSGAPALLHTRTRTAGTIGAPGATKEGCCR